MGKSGKIVAGVSASLEFTSRVFCGLCSRRGNILLPVGTRTLRQTEAYVHIFLVPTPPSYACLGAWRYSAATKRTFPQNWSS